MMRENCFLKRRNEERKDELWRKQLTIYEESIFTTIHPIDCLNNRNANKI